MLRSPYDREILKLAVPALGALAAEPLYVLVDTAIVGHLGTTQLAALAIAATALSSAFTIFNFLTYGTTARVARLHGAGRDEEAARARRAGAVAGGSGSASCSRCSAVALAEPVARIMGADGRILDQAVLYLRIAALGSPFFMLAAAGQGFLRGIGDLRTPLWILLAAHSVNVVLELLFVYGFDWGIAGSAWGTVIAQAGMGAAFVWVQAARVGLGAAAPGPHPLAAADRRRDRGAHDGAARRRSWSPRRCWRGSAPRRSARTRSRSSCSSSSRSCSTRSRSPGR